MNKNEFVDAVYNKSGLTKKDCKLCLEAVIDVIKSALKDGESVVISNFGKFKVSEAKAKNIYSFKTKSTEMTEGGKYASFKASDSLKQMLK